MSTKVSMGSILWIIRVFTISQTVLCCLSLLTLALLSSPTDASVIGDFISLHHNLTKRGAFAPGGTKPKGYDDLVTKGDQLLEMMEGTIAEANAIYKGQTQSRWTPDDLVQARAYGWFLTDDKSKDFPRTTMAHMEMMAEDLKLNTEYPPNADMSYRHERSWFYPGGRNLKGQRDFVEHTATGVEYRNTLNPLGGLVVATASRSPRDEVENSYRGLTIADIPPLEHWSDLTFLQIQSVIRKQGLKPQDAKMNHIVRARVWINKRWMLWATSSAVRIRNSIPSRIGTNGLNAT